jgi:hypothetical protein
MASLDKVYKELSVRKVIRRSRGLPSRPGFTHTAPPPLPQLYKDLLMMAQYLGRRVSLGSQLPGAACCCAWGAIQGKRAAVSLHACSKATSPR